MSGVGSTNAMKKGSGNNPFLAYSEADMQGFLNSAYTGRIVKYTGPSTKTAVPRGNNLNLGDAQNLVVDLTKNFTYSSVSYKSREWNIGIEIENSDNTKTNKCIMNIKIDSKTGIIGSGDNDIQALIYSEYTPYSSLYGKNINEISVKFLAVTSVNVDRDVVVNWPITYGKNGWQSGCFNDLGKITLWGYGETVLAYQNQNNIDYWGNGDIIYTEPYIVNELYKVVYGDGQYYFEEFYYISENVTTATVEDVAPGKTFYDFTGTKQTGTGTKINPYIASTADEMAAYLTSSYKGAFVKYIGETVAVGGTPAPVNPIAVGDILQSTAAGDEGHPILYLNTNVTPDFSQFPDEQMQNESGYSLLDVLEGSSPFPFLTAHKASQGSDTMYALGIGQTVVYAFSETMSPSIMQLEHWGWIYSSPFTVERWGGEAKVSSVNQQDVWGAYISKDGQWTSSGGESYVKNAIYQVAEDGDTTRYMILPALSNPADPIDVAEGKEVINQLGAVMIGTGNNILQASTTVGMQALFIDANIGKIAKYVGETDVYIKDAFYLITSDANAKQYYELPVLANEGTADDLVLGKELINSKGEKVVGLVDLGDIQGKLFYGSVTYNTAVNGVDLSIPGLTKLPKFVLFMANASYGDSKNSVYNVVYPVPYNNNHERSYYLAKGNYGSQNPVTFDENTKRLHIRTGNYDIHGTWYYYIIE